MMSKSHSNQNLYDQAAVGGIYLTYRLLKIIFLFALHSFRFSFRLLIRKTLRHHRSKASVFGESLTALFESLGATFIKAGQILSSRSDLLPLEVINPLSRLQDRVAPFDHRKIPHLIEKAFGRSIDDIFESFDFTPVSSASIAQVHRARLKGGEDVAVKIRRPGLAQVIKSDLLILNSLIGIVERFPAMRLIPIRRIVEEFSLVIGEQVNFHLEAGNNRCFQQNFSKFKQITIPRLYNYLCTESILTMEYLDGLIKVDKLDFNAQQRKEAAIVSLQALYQMMFVDGFVHADMHPGNVFFRDNVEFVILDFGLVARLSDSELKDFASFFLGVATNNGKECARIVRETAIFSTSQYDSAKFECAMIKLIARHSSKVARDFEVSQFAIELFDTQRKQGICGSTKFTMVIVSLIVFEGIAKHIYPDLDFQSEARRFIPSVMNRSSSAPLSPPWWDLVADKWNSSLYTWSLAGMGLFCIRVSDGTFDPIWIEWDKAGRVRRLDQPNGKASCLSATVANWKAFLEGDFNAINGILEGRICYNGELAHLLPYSSALNHFAKIAQGVTKHNLF